MKLATYKDGSRDGQLVVVSRDLSTAHYATGIASKMQQVLDDWNFMAPQLQDLYETLNNGKARHAFPFDPALCMAPLPRAYQWADGSAYINHVELVRAARDSEVPQSFYEDPLMYQGGSDDFIGARDDVVCPSEDYGIDFEAELAVITGDVPMQATPEQALDGIRLVMLANDVSLRHLIPNELTKGFGFFQWQTFGTHHHVLCHDRHGICVDGCLARYLQCFGSVRHEYQRHGSCRCWHLRILQSTAHSCGIAPRAEFRILV